MGKTQAADYSELDRRLDSEPDPTPEEFDAWLRRAFPAGEATAHTGAADSPLVRKALARQARFSDPEWTERQERDHVEAEDFMEEFINTSTHLS